MSQKTLKGTITNLKEKKRKRDSEFQSYVFIKNELRDLGWNTKNPNRDRNGEVYTQEECLKNSQIKEMLGRLTPEYIIKLREDAFWIIEAKSTHEEIEKAYEEAIEYGELINKHKFVRAMIVSGVAGNDIDRYLVKSGFWNEKTKRFEIIKYNDKEITSLISPDIAKRLLEQNSPLLRDFELPEEILAKSAEEINKILHRGSVRKEKRATIIATMLLSLLGETEPNYNASPKIFVDDINNRAKEILEENKKGSFFEHIEIKLPEKPDVQRKFKESLVSTLFLLKKINIKSAMRTGSDVLGKFYESFLKYGNGAKDLGIVLTPRQITEFASEVLNITHKDIVYDPTCGTGGFLVSAFYHVMKNSLAKQLNDFKQYKIFGIDQQPSVSALAIVNMLFRGDGKNNIINDDCLMRQLKPTVINGVVSAKFVSNKKSEIKPVTKVLMNPPFSLPDSKEKEFHFVNHALEQMDNDGLLFSVLPCSVMVKSGVFKKWRVDLLKNNTLLSVITFPNDLFYPQSAPPTLAIIVKKGISHQKENKVLWTKIRNDGYRKVKAKRLRSPKVPDELLIVKDVISSFIINQKIPTRNIREFQKAIAIDFSDDNLELIPEAYLDEHRPSEIEIKNAIEDSLRNTISFMIKSKKEKDFKREVIDDVFFDIPKHTNLEELKEIQISDLFNVTMGNFHVSGKLDEGEIPLISCSALDNGVEGYFRIADDKIYKNAITIASDGAPLTSFFHYYDFAVKDNVMVCISKEKLKFTTLLFITIQVNRLRWRFSYGRKCYLNKLNKIKIFLPTKNGKIDENYIERLIKNSEAWNIFLSLFKEK